MANTKTTHKQWTLIHHENNDVIELVLDGKEGTERIWLTYEECNSLKELIGATKIPVLV